MGKKRSQTIWVDDYPLPFGERLETAYCQKWWRIVFVESSVLRVFRNKGLKKDSQRKAPVLQQSWFSDKWTSNGKTGHTKQKIKDSR